MMAEQGPKAGLLSMGRFAQTVGLTRKALRLYDQLGILVPDHIDPDSGYRYYSLCQYERARKIRLLRAMEMPLADIRRVLDAATLEDALHVIEDCQLAYESRSDQVRSAYRKVLSVYKKEAEPMAVSVEIKTLPAFKALTIKRRIKIPEFHSFIPQALGELDANIKRHEGQIAGEPICFYYGPLNKNDDGPVEICLPFEGQVEPDDGFQVREITAHQAAVGRADPKLSQFPEILEVWDDVIHWVQQNKLDIKEDDVPCYEIWHADRSISVVQPCG
jgi:DNA-binding transcriptional MerR regulator